MDTSSSRNVRPDTVGYEELCVSMSGLATYGATRPNALDARDTLAAIGAESAPALPRRRLAAMWHVHQVYMYGDAAAADRWAAALLGAAGAPRCDWNTCRAIRLWQREPT